MKEIPIDFNQEDVMDLVKRLRMEGEDLNHCVLVLTEKQFNIFKKLYSLVRVNYDLPRSSANRHVVAKTGIICGMEYKVKE